MHAVRTGWRVLVGVAACLAVWAGSFDDHVFAEGDKACSLDGVSVMAFGTYDPMSSAHLDMQGQVSYRCYPSKNGDSTERSNTHGNNGNGPLTVQISLSQGAAGTFQRHMNGERDSLRYNLYTDAQRTVIWGDGTGGTTVYSQKAQPNNKVETIPVFGRVFGAQDVSASEYLDNLVVTLNY
jgi:spore coat protein U-like protein